MARAATPVGASATAPGRPHACRHAAPPGRGEYLATGHGCQGQSETSWGDADRNPPVGGRAVGGGRPQPKVSEDLVDDRGLLDKRDDPPGSRALGTHERIHLVHLRDQASASSAERRAHARFASESQTSLN